MKYVNAHTILPKDLVEELQKYIQDTFIFLLPERKNAGESTAAIEPSYSCEMKASGNAMCPAARLRSFPLSMHYRHMLSRKSFIKNHKNAAAFFFSTKQVCTILWLAASAPLPIQ